MGMGHGPVRVPDTVEYPTATTHLCTPVAHMPLARNRPPHVRTSVSHVSTPLRSVHMSQPAWRLRKDPVSDALGLFLRGPPHGTSFPSQLGGSSWGSRRLATSSQISST
eukprot:1393704-Prymnesium_polylepis.1